MKKSIIVLTVITIINLGLIGCHYKRPDGSDSKLNEALPKTRGSPIPKPQTHVKSDTQHYIDIRSFRFSYAEGSKVCDVIDVAFNRYHKIMFRPENYKIHDFAHIKRKSFPKSNLNVQDLTVLNKLVVNIHQECEEYPGLESDESYVLQVNADLASIDAQSLWGALRGIQTFSQLVIENDIGSYTINETYIKDFPRFNHRGILLDSSRHFLDISILKTNLEAMEANKMNVFHWHITDDQSFPYESTTYPDLSNLGAYDPYNHVYTQEDIKELIEFARLRGIRVIPEFDSPGHTLSFGNAVPILTPCYSGSKPNGEFGPMDPSNNLTYAFWNNFLKELTQTFPDKYLHLGGDEVDFDCWSSNPNVNKFMKKMGFGNDFSKLEQYYMQNLLNIVNQVSSKSQYIIWQEVIDNNVVVKPETVVEVWKGPWEDEMQAVTKLGYRTILSTCWYLNYISYGSDWVDYYKCDPWDFDGTQAQKNLVIGGEACMWGEYVDGTNVIQRTWPRAAAVAERLWSARDVKDTNDASARIEEQRCRMVRRGINAEPFDGSGYCNYEWKQ